MVGCAGIPLPSVDIVPPDEALAIDGIWNMKKDNLVYKVRIEKGRGYFVDDGYDENGFHQFRKNGVFVQNLRYTGGLKYTGLCGNIFYYYQGVTDYFESLCEVEITSQYTIQIHLFKRKNLPEKDHITCETVNLDNEKLLFSIIDKNNIDNAPTSTESSTIALSHERNVPQVFSNNQPNINSSSKANLTEEMRLQSENSIAYDLRGAKLGMTLDEFRSMPFPDQQGGREVNLICVGANQDFSMSFPRYSFDETDRELAVTKCSWAEKNSFPRDQNDIWRETHLVVGNLIAKDVTYSFIKSPDTGEQRLYDITVILGGFNGYDNGFSTISKALVAKYGKPSSIENGESQNKMGAKFSNTQMKWQNAESTIHLSERFTEIDNMFLNYSLNNLAKYHREHSSKKEMSEAINTL